ncbi:ATP-binding protein [Desulfosarcina ovata]|nr:ATP-binding protein [Desulfosarcina ovata]
MKTITHVNDGSDICLKAISHRLESNRDIFISRFSKENEKLPDAIKIAEKYITALERFFRTGLTSQESDPFIKMLMASINQNQLDLTRTGRLVSSLRNMMFDFLDPNIANEKQVFQKLNQYLDEVLEEVTITFDQIVKKQALQIEAIQKRKDDFKTSKQKRGWLDFAGIRMCMTDFSGNWLNLWRAMILFAGEDTARRVFFEAGIAELFSKTCLENSLLKNNAEGFTKAVDAYSEAGFGDFYIRELIFENGFTRITCQDTFEAWTFAKKNKKNEYPFCYHSTGVLLSFMRTLTGRSDLVAEEVKCIAKGDPECEFVIGTKNEFKRRNIPLTVWGQTLKEKAKFLETMLNEKEVAEKALLNKYNELTIINKIGRDISQSLNIDTILNLSVLNLSRIVGNKDICIYLINRKSNELILKAQKGFSKDYFKNLFRFKMEEGISGDAAHKMVPVEWNNQTNLPIKINYDVKNKKIKSILSVPLKTKNKVIGVLNIAAKFQHHFAADEIDLISLIGSQISGAIENAYLLEEIRDSEKKYRTLVENINDGYFLCQDDHVLYANSAFLYMHGYSKSEVLGKDFRKFLPKENVAQVEKILSGTWGKEIPEHIEFQRKHKNNKKLPTDLKINLIKFNGKPALICILRDISKRKEMEKKVIEHQRLSSIGQLTADIAHEIRNPLSSIKTNIQVLSKQLHLQGFNKRRMEIAVEEILRLDRILQDVLNFSVPVKMEMSLDHLHNVIGKCVELIHEKIRRSKINVIQKLSRDIPEIYMNTGMFQQVILNLFLNSIDAMPNGGQIIITTRRIEIEDHKMILLEIMDSGCGIQSENLNRVFDPFFSTKTQGAGLGLSNVKKIIDAHHGSIEIENRANQGTRIIIKLPENKNAKSPNC